MKHALSERGFKHMPTIKGTYEDSSLRLYESSRAFEPHVWIAVQDKNTGEAHVHLTLKDAETLRDQLAWLLENHYQVEKGWLGPEWLGRFQFWLQQHPGASKDWTWRMRVGNAISSVRYFAWKITGGREQ